MEFEFELLVGSSKFMIRDQAESHAEFFEKASFFANLPLVGPNGETDLKLLHRTTSKGHNYYSIVSEKAKLEFKFGQSQQNPGSLFAKGWKPLYERNSDNDNQIQRTNNGVGLGVNQAPQFNNVGLGNTQPQQQVQQQVTQQNLQNQSVPPQVQQNNQQVASDVLAKFGITN